MWNIVSYHVTIFCNENGPIVQAAENFTRGRLATRAFALRASKIMGEDWVEEANIKQSELITSQMHQNLIEKHFWTTICQPPIYLGMCAYCDARKYRELGFDVTIRQERGLKTVCMQKYLFC